MSRSPGCISRALLALSVVAISGVPDPPLAAPEPGSKTFQEPVSLELPDLEGASRSLGDYRGGIVILNFWATWCIPCRQEMPILVELQEKYAERGVQVIAVSADEVSKREAVERFAAEAELNFPVWLGATTLDMERFGLGSALPATALIDRHGHIAGRVRGVVDHRDLTRRIEALLAVGAVPKPVPSADPPGVAEAPGELSSAGVAEEPVPADLEEAAPSGDGEPGDLPAAHDRGSPDEHGHDLAHGEEEEHGHGGVGIEGASLVPS